MTIVYFTKCSYLCDYTSKNNIQKKVGRFDETPVLKCWIFIHIFVYTFYQSVCNIARFGSRWSGICLTWAYKIQQTSNRFQCIWTVALSLAPILWMNTWHSPHFNFPINHSHSVNHRLCVHTYTINPCLYQPTSVLYCAPSPHSADKGPRTKTSCNIVANFYAMLSKKALWNTVHNIAMSNNINLLLNVYYHKNLNIYGKGDGRAWVP